MPLKIFNTMTRQKEEFAPLNPPVVGIYVCGVTVYDRCHIGHARAYVAFDTIVRHLRYRGYRVKFVRNFTDVDDKIINRANELGIPAKELSQRYIEEFRADMKLLNVLQADVEPRVTEHIPQIVVTIKKILENGHGYLIGGDVYFSIDSFGGYGALSKRNLEEMTAGGSERVAVDERKRNPLDFALWKSSKPGEPAWDSPWGPGRPGWHIECSTMSMLYLGDLFDIHGGGMDLIFPHHENELAQSKAATGKDFVRFWLHNGFVNINEEKMSKSLGNFCTIRDVVEVFHPEAMRYLLLGTHYRSPINYTEKNLEDAVSRVQYVYETIQRAEEYLAGRPAAGAKPDEPAFSKVVEAMDDDFNTALALAHIADVLKELNEVLDKKEFPEKASKAAALLAAMREATMMLGLFGANPGAALAEIRGYRMKSLTITEEEIGKLIAERTECRKNRNFKRGDEIRDILKEKGVTIMDSPGGTRWKI
ncbi:MAG: cysteine--tRNA ligase [Deltaproteobacteria bacterium]|nr:cysteine--tRNA ligase [Deltaproteobacteria bacterium]